MIGSLFGARESRVMNCDLRRVERPTPGAVAVGAEKQASPTG